MRLLTFFLAATASVCAQSEADLVRFFEGKSVVVKIDMPATKDGVAIYPERTPPLDARTYGKRMKDFGAALKTGQSVMITKVKVKDDHVEFQLGGGGYGTIGDEADTPVVARPTEKSQREKDLETELSNETDSDERDDIKRRLNDLRDARARQDQRNREAADLATQEKRERIEVKRLDAGSRFNIIYKEKISPGALTPQSVMAALAEYVDFSSLNGGSATTPPVKR